LKYGRHLSESTYKRRSPRTRVFSPAMAAGGHASEHTRHAVQEKVAFDSGDRDVGECPNAFETPAVSGAGPWRKIDPTLRACEADALMTVGAVRGCAFD
jgi:hypothetical protein